MKKLFTTLLAMVAFATSAQEITGAGATFPTPLYSKWAGVVFSVDGLEDTNHIYRRGVKWEKLITNMRAYSATGAYAVWEWLVFEHNQHQVEEARALAKELNFQFIVKNPLGFGEYDGEAKGLSVYNKE